MYIHHKASTESGESRVATPDAVVTENQSGMVGVSRRRRVRRAVITKLENKLVNILNRSLRLFFFHYSSRAKTKTPVGTKKNKNGRDGDETDVFLV